MTQVNDRLSPLLKPRNIALIGASERASHSVALMQNLLKFGFPKDAIHPVNPRHEMLFDLPCYPTVREIPGDVDLAVFAIPRDNVMKALEDCASKKVKSALIVATGFGEFDETGRRYQAEISQLVQQHNIALCGPNTLGFIALDGGAALWSSPLPGHLEVGSVGAVFSSSGLLNLFFHSAADRCLGFRYAIAPGNQVGVGFTDYFRWLIEDPDTRVIVTVIESMPRPDEMPDLLDMARQNKKIVIALRLGRSQKGGTAIASHSGNMATSGAVWDGLFRQKGVISVDNMDEMLEVTALATADHDTLRFPPTGGVGIVTISGGDCSFLADICERNQLDLPEPTPATYDRLRPFFGKDHFNGNPLDIEDLHVANEAKYLSCLETFLRDENFAVVCCRLSLPRIPNDRLKELYRKSVAVAAKTGKKLFFLSRASELLDRSWFHFFAELKVPFLLEYEKSLRAVRNILHLSRRGLVSDRITNAPVSPEVVASLREKLASNGNRPPDGALVQQVLTTYGIRIAPEHLASSREDAMEAAARMGFPVALKIQSADLPHKTEVGGVLLHLGSEQEVASGYGQLVERVARAAPDAKIEGTLVQKMVDGVAEVIVGVSPTKDLGMCVVFGLGGIYTEVLKDVVFRLPPLSIADATDMIGEIKAYPVLTGARGRPSGDLRALAETIVAISRLAQDFSAHVVGIEFNPLLVLPEGEGVVAVDTLLQVKAG